MDAHIRDKIQSKEIMMNNLIRFNRNMGFLHLVQGGAILVLSLIVDVFRDFQPPVSASFLQGTRETYGPVSSVLFDLPFGILVSLFLLLSAFFHFLIAYVRKDQYLADLEKGRNSLRFYEYALSSSIMIVLLATMFGVLSIEGLLLIFVVNALMNLFGLLMEVMNPIGREKTDWRPYFFGWIAGIAPWVIIVVYMLGSSDLSNLPWFVIPGLLFYFLVFNTFAVNQYLQFKGLGKWKDYVYGERMYVVLSLIGKSVLAWFIFIGILLA